MRLSASQSELIAAIEVSDSDRSILASECLGTILVIRLNGSISEPRTIALPLANSVPVGYRIYINDESGTPSWWHPVLITLSGSNTIGELTQSFPLNKPWQSLTFLSNGDDKWSVVADVVSRRDLWVVEDDFLHGGSHSQSGFSAFGFGEAYGGSNIGGAPDALGAASIPTGSATSFGQYGYYNGALRFGTATWRFTTRAIINTPPDSVNNYIIDLGFSNAYSNEATNGVYYLIDRALNANNLLACTAYYGSRTRVDTGIPFSALTSWKTLSISVNGTGTQAKFFVDSSEVAAIGTNIPVDLYSTTGIIAQNRKTSGTNNRQLSLDWLKYLYYSNTPR